MPRTLIESDVFDTEGNPRSDKFSSVTPSGDVFIGKNEIIGNGTDTDFTVPHLQTGVTTDSSIITTPRSAAAMEPAWFDVNATNILVKFKTAPVNDASIVFNWQIVI